MRITQNMMTWSALNGMQENMERLAELQKQAYTGKSLTAPEDDPFAMEQTLGFRARYRQGETALDNVAGASDWLYATETALGDMVDTNLGIRVETAVIEGVTASQGPQEREAVATEIDGLLEQAVMVANTRHGHRFVFSGFQTDTQPFVVTRSVSDTVASAAVTGFDTSQVPTGNSPLDQGDYRVEVNAVDEFRIVKVTASGSTPVEIADITAGDGSLTDGWQAIAGGNYDTGRGMVVEFGAGPPYPTGNATATYGGEITHIAYHGDDGVMTRQIEPGNEVVINLSGDPMFTDILNELITLREAFRETDFDPNAVYAARDNITDDFEEVMNMRGAIGTRARGLETAKERISAEQIFLDSLISQNEDADLAELITKLTQQQYVYESSLAASGRTMQMSLMDFLG